MFASRITRRFARPDRNHPVASFSKNLGALARGFSGRGAERGARSARRLLFIGPGNMRSPAKAGSIRDRNSSRCGFRNMSLRKKLACRRSEAGRVQSLNGLPLRPRPFFRDLLAFLARFRKTDGNGLFAAFYFAGLFTAPALCRAFLVTVQFAFAIATCAFRVLSFLGFFGHDELP